LFGFIQVTIVDFGGPVDAFWFSYSQHLSIYLAVDFKRSWWRLLQNLVVCAGFDINVFNTVTDIVITLCYVFTIWNFGTSLMTNNGMGGSNVVERIFEHRSGQTKDYKVRNSCFSAKQAALWGKINDWLSRKQGNVSEWSDMSTCELWASSLKIQLSVLV
jgi:hypothetical protein